MMYRSHHIDQSLHSDEYWALWHLEADLDYWYSYTSQGLQNAISNHSRKDQRTYQRKFCSFLSRRDRFIEANIELFI